MKFFCSVCKSPIMIEQDQIKGVPSFLFVVPCSTCTGKIGELSEQEKTKLLPLLLQIVKFQSKDVDTYEYATGETILADRRSPGHLSNLIKRLYEELKQIKTANNS